MARAFCRFETYCQLFNPLNNIFRRDLSVLKVSVEFLELYHEDRVEEIMCVEDSPLRKLWGVFDRIEDDFLSGMPVGCLRKARKEADPEG